MIIIRKIKILNPVAGKGDALDYKDTNNDGFETYISTGVGDAENFVYEETKKPGNFYIVVYGGDGTLNEVVNGIIRAGSNDRVELSMVATGSGNDFIKNFPDENNSKMVDLIKYNDRYAINVVNAGFDGKVVVNVGKYKRLPLVSGSMAYIFAVIDVLFKKLGEHYEIELINEDGSVESFKDEFLLAVAANGSYYGGGFMAAPLAKLDDGLLDVVLVKKISRWTLLKLILAYRKGAHIDPISQVPIDSLSKFMSYKRCSKIKIKNITEICADGEIEYIDEVEISVLPKKIKYIY